MKRTFIKETLWFMLAALLAYATTRILSCQNYAVLNRHFNYIHYQVDTAFIIIPLFLFLLFIIYGIRTAKTKFSIPFANWMMLLSGLLSVVTLTLLTRTFYHAGFLELNIYPPLSQLGPDQLPELKPNPFFDGVSKFISGIQILLVAALVLLTFKWGKTRATPNLVKFFAFILISTLALPCMG